MTMQRNQGGSRNTIVQGTMLRKEDREDRGRDGQTILHNGPGRSSAMTGVDW